MHNQKKIENRIAIPGIESIELEYRFNTGLPDPFLDEVVK